MKLPFPMPFRHLGPDEELEKAKRIEEEHKLRLSQLQTTIEVLMRQAQIGRSRQRGRT